MTQVTVHQAKTHLSKLIQKALAGEEVVIAKRDQPLVRLDVIKPEKPKRIIGWGKGLVTYVAPDFDDPLPEFAAYMETAEEEKVRLTREAKKRRK